MDSFWQHQHQPQQDQGEHHIYNHAHNHTPLQEHPQHASPTWNATQLSYHHSPPTMPPQYQYQYQGYSTPQHHYQHSPHVSLSTAAHTRVPFQPLSSNSMPMPTSTLPTPSHVPLPRAKDGRWDLRRQQALSLPRAPSHHQHAHARPMNPSPSAQVHQNSPCQVGVSAFDQDYAQACAQQFSYHQQQQTDPPHLSPTHYTSTQHAYTQDYLPSHRITPQGFIPDSSISTPQRHSPDTSPSTLQRLRKFAYQKPVQLPPQDERVTSSTPAVAVAPIPKRPINTKQIDILNSGTRNDDASPSSSPTASNPPQPDGIQLVPVSSIPAQFKSMFHFPVFNAVQSTCFDAVFRSDDNVVISAPTGAGKTVLFELAIIRMLQQSDTCKAVYMAPTKSLCTQKASEWKENLQAVPCSVVELTGDSDFAGVAAAKAARVIVTTPEKWDAMTRNWSLNRRLLDSLNLMLIDEVHTLREKARGPRFEIVVSRMHAFGNNVRFIAVSATVPNVVDIAEWLGKRKPLVKAGEVLLRESSSSPDRARVFEFGEEFRPCPLKKVVYGYQGPPDQWSFQTTLNSKLLQVVSEHSSDKPTLIFVPTRKATTQAAQALQQSYEKHMHGKKTSKQAPWTVPSNAACPQYHDTTLRELSTLGIAFHHAGLDLDDRKLVERNFLKGSIRILCCTSTLAVGVNLPAYCVIIRGTKRYEGQWAEVSDLDLLQMLGRAGRPQFDRSGVAVIMTEQSRKDHYESMVSGCTMIESRLHEELVEHINSEIGLRDDCTVADLEKWLGSTFLAVRSRKNPSFYENLENVQQDINYEERLRRICSEALERLITQDLVARGPRGLLNSTVYGEILSTYMLSFHTMLSVLTIERASLKGLIEVLCSASEFSDIRMRAGEKTALIKLRAHCEIRFPPDKVSGVPEKISLLLQSVLAGLPLRTLLQTNEATINPLGDTITIFRHCPRIVKAMTDVALHRQDAVSAKNAFELLRSVNGRSWDASSTTLSQLEGIGEKSVKVLASAGFFTYQQVATADPFHLEMLLKKNPPFGFRLVEEAASLPHFTLDASTSGKLSARRGVGAASDLSSTEISVDIQVHLKQPAPQNGKQIRPAAKSKRGHSLHVAILTLTSDGQHLFDFRRLPMKFLIKNKVAAFTLRCKLTKSGQRIVVHAGVDEIAGSGVRKELDPGIDPRCFAASEVEEIRQSGRGGDREFLEDDWNELRDCHNLFDGSDDLELEAQDEMQVIDPATFYAETTSPRISNSTWSPPLRRCREVDDDDGGVGRSGSLSRSGSAYVPRKKRQTETEASYKTTSTSASMSLATEPLVLANGNYRCNHNCKDRKTCRHLCCREGLQKPPKVARASKKKASQREITKAVRDFSEEEDELASDQEQQDSLPENYDLPSSPSSSPPAYVVDANHRKRIQPSTPSAPGRKKLTGKTLQAENNALLQRMESLAQKARSSIESHGGRVDSEREEEEEDATECEAIRQPREPIRLTLPPKTKSSIGNSPGTKMTTSTHARLPPHKTLTKEDHRRDKYSASFEVPAVPTRVPGSTTSAGSSSSSPPAEFEQMFAGLRDTCVYPFYDNDPPCLFPQSSSSSSLSMTLYEPAREHEHVHTNSAQQFLDLPPAQTQEQGQDEVAVAVEGNDPYGENEQWGGFAFPDERREQGGEDESWWDFVEWENLSSDVGLGNVSVEW